MKRGIKHRVGQKEKNLINEYNICLTVFLEVKEKKNEKEDIFEEMLATNFPEQKNSTVCGFEMPNKA